MKKVDRSEQAGDLSRLEGVHIVAKIDIMELRKKWNGEWCQDPGRPRFLHLSRHRYRVLILIFQVLILMLLQVLVTKIFRQDPMLTNKDCKRGDQVEHLGLHLRQPRLLHWAKNSFTTCTA